MKSNTKMRFRVEQVAIHPDNPGAAKELLVKLGATDWSEDEVRAIGKVFGGNAANRANLSFNYQLIEKKEFEILHYAAGSNWMQGVHGVSHLGMHCTADELVKWREFFAGLNIDVAQEVLTQSHTNPSIAGKRRYQYVIFNTRRILGLDLKFIVRMDA